MTLSLWFWPALFHALAAGAQQVLRKRLLAVASSYQLGAMLFGIAGVLLAGIHIIHTGQIWFVGDIPEGFWLAMVIFVLANSIAAVLSLQVLEGTTLSHAMTIICLSVGLLVLADWTVFGQTPSIYGWIGIALLIVSFFFMKEDDAKKRGGISAQKKSRKLMIKSFVAMAIYNYVTPSTNKFCSLSTSGLFTSWVAHLLIGITLLGAWLVLERGKKLNLEDGKVRGFVLGLSVVAVLIAASNGLLSISFAAGASIPAALLMKRVLPPLVVFLVAIATEGRAGEMSREKWLTIGFAALGSTMIGLR